MEALCSCSLGHDFIEQEFVTAYYALRLPWRPWPISELFREGTKAESGESTSDEASTSTGVGSSEGHTVAGQARETLQQMSLDLGSLSADPLYVSSTVPAASVARDKSSLCVLGRVSSVPPRKRNATVQMRPFPWGSSSCKEPKQMLPNLSSVDVRHLGLEP